MTLDKVLSWLWYSPIINQEENCRIYKMQKQKMSKMAGQLSLTQFRSSDATKNSIEKHKTYIVSCCFWFLSWKHVPFITKIRMFNMILHIWRAFPPVYIDSTFDIDRFYWSSSVQFVYNYQCFVNFDNSRKINLQKSIRSDQFIFICDWW